MKKKHETSAIYNEILKVEPLSPDEEFKVIERYQKDNNEVDLELLVKANLRFVYGLALQYHNNYPGISLDGLFTEGSYGLIKGINKFDPTRGFKLISYAVWWIKASMRLHIQEHNRVFIPTQVQADNKKITKFSNKYFNENGFEPSMWVISDGTGLTEKRVEFVIKNSKTRISSYDDLIGEEERNFIDNYSIPIDNSEELAKERITKILTRVIDYRSNFILVNYHGIDTDKLTMKEIAEELELTTSRVRQIHQDTLDKLRSHPTKKITNSKAKFKSGFDTYSKAKPLNQADDGLTDEDITEIINKNKIKIKETEKEVAKIEQQIEDIEVVEVKPKSFLKRLFNKLIS